MTPWKIYEIDLALPTYLYHYTSVDTLALILKYRTIRFTRLSLLNDPLEGKAKDFEGGEELIYCSSWSANPADTIPMWKMYTNLEGVRIRLKLDNVFSDSCSMQFKNYGSKLSPVTELCCPIQMKHAIDSSRVGYIKEVFGPEEVEYLNSEEYDKLKFTQRVKSIEHDRVVENDCIQLDGAGLHKPICWSHEQEWRFRVIGLPSVTPINMSLNDYVAYAKYAEDSVDIPMSSKCFDELEILLGPLCSEGHEYLVESLCDRAGIDVSITKSGIRISK